MILQQLLLVIWTLSTLGAFVSCTSADSFWIHNFTRLRWVSSAVAHGKLYIDGGEIYNRVGDRIDTSTMGSTVIIDLQTPWTNSTVRYAAAVDKSDEFPFARAPYIWYNTVESKIQSIGGLLYGQIFSQIWHVGSQKHISVITQETEQELHDLPSDQGKWIKSSAPPSPYIGLLQQGMGVATNDSFYMFGGALFSGIAFTDYLIPGIIQDNFKNNFWANSSTRGYGPSGSGAFGQAVYTPLFGAKGVIVYLGGYTGPEDHIIYQEGPQFLQDMGTIFLYDIASRKVLIQHTTGTKPPKRWGFMAVGVSESGSGTFDIFVHGGFAAAETNEKYNADLANVFVLSIPSFVWTRIPSSTASMRALGTAQVAGRSQMIIVGGDDPTRHGGNLSKLIPGRRDNLIPDPWDNGIGVFDLNAWRWATRYDPDAAAYTRARTLVQQSKRTPYAHFDSAETAKIFGPESLRNASGGDGPNNTGTNHAGVNHAGAIAGGIVGGVAALALIALLALCFIRRKRSAKKSRHGLILPEQTIKKDQYATVQAYEVDGHDRHVELEDARGQAWEIGTSGVEHRSELEGSLAARREGRREPGAT